MNRGPDNAGGTAEKNETPEKFPDTAPVFADLENMYKSVDERRGAKITSITSEETPQGLQILAHLDKIVVHQEVEMLELMTGIETENKYKIINPEKKQQILFAQEQALFVGCLCCARRPVELSICNVRNEEIIHMSKEKRCQGPACCICGIFCLQKMEVFSPPGNFLGSINQKWNFFFPSFAVKDNNGKTLFRIKGPYCTYGTVDFMVTSAKNGEEIGIIEKEWGGWGVESYTDVDVFGIDLKQDLSVEVNIINLSFTFTPSFTFN